MIRILITNQFLQNNLCFNAASQIFNFSKTKTTFIKIIMYDICKFSVEWDSCCVQCAVKFPNRERGIEFCRFRKIIKLLFIQDQVRLRQFLGRALRLGQSRGPSAAATCVTFKTPPAASLCAGISQILFFWIYKIQSPSPCFGILRRIAHNLNPTLPSSVSSVIKMF